MKDFAETTRPIGLMLAGAVAILLPATAFAADPAPDLTMSNNPLFDTVVYWGGEFTTHSGGKDGYGAGAGFVTAVNGDIGATGWTLTGNFGGSRTDDGPFETKSFYAAALVGYQWHAPGYYFTLAAGVNYVNNDETPSGGPTDGGEAGAIIQYGVETKQVNAFYAQSYGAYSTAHDTVYLHAKAGYKTPNLRFGPEFTLFDEGTSRSTLRYGAFIGDIAITQSVNMVVSAGYQHELEPTAEDGFYATIGFSTPLSLR